MASMTITLLPGCGNLTATGGNDESASHTPAPWDLVEEGESPLPTNHSYDYAEDTTNPVPDSTLTPETILAKDTTVIIPDLSRYRSLGRLDEVFNDSNKYQYAAGERIGIDPITGVADAYFLKRPLIKVSSCELYSIDQLTHSMPYLVPEAASLLETIGRNFRDSLKSKNKEGHKFRVTSLLRSAHSVKKLKRVNRNATDSSTHQLGTTFDITYSTFDHDRNAKSISDEELKYVLAEVLRDLRAANKCMVKYEIKSPCFHITATGR